MPHPEFEWITEIRTEIRYQCPDHPKDNFGGEILSSTPGTCRRFIGQLQIGGHYISGRPVCGKQLVPIERPIVVTRTQRKTS